MVYYSIGQEGVLIQIILLVGLVILIVVLLATLTRLRKSDYSVLANHMADRSRTGLQVMRPCPVCGTLITKGERVHTVVYSGTSVVRRSAGSGDEAPQESLVHMFGCPYCYPPSPSYPRTCPVCDATIPDDGYIVARMFEKNGRRKHVHVLGCTECRESAKRGQARHSG